MLREGDEAQALARFRAFIERYPDSLLLPQAQLAAHDTAFRLGLWADAEREARRFLARAPAHPEAGRILVRLAEARAAQGQVAEAIADLRRRWIEAPASAWGEAARESMEDLARRRRVARGAAHHRGAAPPGPAPRGRGRAERVGPAPRGAPGPGPGADRAPPGAGPARADARASRPGRRGDRAARRRPGGAGDVAARGRHATSSAGCSCGAGRPGAGRLVFERLLAEHPEASNVPDVLLQLARARAELGQFDAAREAFQGVITRYPDSTAAASARWEVAWLEYRAGRLPGVGPRLPPALDDGRQRSARGPLLGGPLRSTSSVRRPRRSPSTARC